jgi:hypothetical protein
MKIIKEKNGVRYTLTPDEICMKEYGIRFGCISAYEHALRCLEDVKTIEDLEKVKKRIASALLNEKIYHESDKFTIFFDPDPEVKQFNISEEFIANMEFKTIDEISEELENKKGINDYE